MRQGKGQEGKQLRSVGGGDHLNPVAPSHVKDQPRQHQRRELRADELQVQRP